MSLFLSFRSAPKAGSVLAEPHILEGNGLVAHPALRQLPALPKERFEGREIVFATHGFNVNFESGVHSLARLEGALALPNRFLFVGVLWPGDWWIPVINYPAEADDAVRCGRNLARFINTKLSRAAALSLVSHSLGGRLVLETVKQMERPAREVCVMAAATDDDCLTSAQYDAARRNCGRVSVLASKGDRVLRLAYPIGDFLSDLFFDDDDRPTRKALGYHGPHPAAKEKVLHTQIPGTRYGHFDYLPPDDLTQPVAQHARPIHWVSEALQGLPHVWPP